MEYYNKIAKSYNELHEKEQLEKTRIILKFIKPSGLLLDIGAGTGISTKPFEKYCMCIALRSELHEKEQLEKTRIILKFIKPSGLLLDIGAGTGISTKPFEKYCMCIALDPSKELLKRYKGNKILAKAENLPFKDKTFDVIISVTVLHHTNIKKALKEIFRVAKPNAQIALTILKKSKLAKTLEKEDLFKDFKKI